MLNANALRKSRTHHSVVLETSPYGFDEGAATFGSIFVNEDDPNTLFLFYSGAQDVKWSHVAIGLATSKNGLGFKKVDGNPVLEGSPKSFYYKEALTPAVTRINNRFYMVFAGKPSDESFRRLGIAYADDPKGPWHVIGELAKPTYLWEGRDIDNGPCIVKLEDETVLVFYSNVTSWKAFDFFAIMRRYPIRRIGVLKVKIRGTSMSSIEVHKFSGNPLKHLNGSKGNWNESVFCPGYIQLHDTHYLFPATSTYSTGFPYKQYIGIVASDSPFFPKTTSHVEKLVDGPSEKSLIIPHIRGEIALDAPAPLLRAGGEKLFLFYSVMDQANQVWKIALTTFNLRELD